MSRKPGCSLGFCHHVDFRVVASPYVWESKTVLESEFHAVDSGFQLLDSRSFSMKLDSGFQLSVTFRIPRFRIPDSTCKNFPDARIRSPLLGASCINLVTQKRPLASGFSWETANCKLQSAVTRLKFHVAGFQILARRSVQFIFL